jgi:hypothetical protein
MIFSPRLRPLWALLALTAALLACNYPRPTPTVIPLTALPDLPTAPVPPPTAAAPPLTFQLYLIALEDGGASGPLVGCGDSLIAVPQPLPPDAIPFPTALDALLTTPSNPPRAYNALAQSALALESIDMTPAGVQQIRLTGELRLGGVCDNPRAQAQLEATANQFANGVPIEILLNGVPLSAALSEQG